MGVLFEPRGFVRLDLGDESRSFLPLGHIQWTCEHFGNSGIIIWLSTVVSFMSISRLPLSSPPIKPDMAETQIVKAVKTTHACLSTVTPLLSRAHVCAHLRR